MTIQPNWFFRATVFCLVTIALLLPAQAQDADSASTTPYKIGVVDMTLLLKDNAKRQKRYEDLQVEVDDRQAALDVTLTELEKKRKRWEEERDTLTDEERLTLKNELQAETDDYSNEIKKNQRYIDNREQIVLREVIGDIESAIKQVSADENFHLVLNAKSDPGRGFPYFALLYHSPTIDITSKVLEFLNTQ